MTAMNENIELMMPIKAAPYDHQKKAFAFACDKFGVFDERLKSRGTALLMEMGIGKTIVSIAVARCMYQYGKVNRVLVVAPLSILGVWEEEFDKFADFPYSLTILKGTVAKKKEHLTKLPDEGLQVVVVNYESAWRLEKELLAYNADLIIADEAHKLKENRSKQSKGLHTLGDKARFKLLLTGTVITNRELDVFSQYRFLNPQIFGTSFYAFRNQYFDMGGYFSVVDVVGVLTDSVDPTAYWRKLKQRLKAEGNETVTNCHGLKMTAHDGKKRLTDVADTEQRLRIIQSIPSPKAEPFKLWLAQVGREHIEETIDPELTIERAMETYLKKGYTREWINQRLQAIQVRKELTDEWDARGVQKGVEYAILTDEISRAWSGMSTRQYKNLKGLKKENLRDNMTTLELVLNMLAEATTTEISKQKAPATLSENIDVARAGGKVAGDARKAIETQTGVPVITSKNAAQLSEVVTNLLEDAGNKEK